LRLLYDTLGLIAEAQLDLIPVASTVPFRSIALAT